MGDAHILSDDFKRKNTALFLTVLLENSASKYFGTCPVSTSAPPRLTAIAGPAAPLSVVLVPAHWPRSTFASFFLWPVQQHSDRKKFRDAQVPL